MWKRHWLVLQAPSHLEGWRTEYLWKIRRRIKLASRRQRLTANMIYLWGRRPSTRGGSTHRCQFPILDFKNRHYYRWISRQSMHQCWVTIQVNLIAAEEVCASILSSEIYNIIKHRLDHLDHIDHQDHIDNLDHLDYGDHREWPPGEPGPTWQHWQSWPPWLRKPLRPPRPSGQLWPMEPLCQPWLIKDLWRR